MGWLNFPRSVSFTVPIPSASTGSPAVSSISRWGRKLLKQFRCQQMWLVAAESRIHRGCGARVWRQLTRRAQFLLDGFIHLKY
ncbi:hypothetical protein N7536_000083 [Penicillium majusculum]|nr:hypothetical protein N7536_000083 [Penicillium majusculum]